MNLNSKINPFFIFIIIILVFSRIIPHPPNFTPIIASAVLVNYFVRNNIFSLIILFGSMIISDLIIGLHDGIYIVYFSLLLIFYISNIFFKKLDIKNILINSIISSSIFFLITNFGVWLNGNMYEKSLNGLINCYTLALPFFNNTIASTIFYLTSIYLILLFVKRVNFKKFKS